MKRLILLFSVFLASKASASGIEVWYAKLLEENIISAQDGKIIGPSFGGQIEIYKLQASQDLYSKCSDRSFVEKILAWNKACDWGGEYLLDFVLLKSGNFRLEDSVGEKLNKVSKLLENGTGSQLFSVTNTDSLEASAKKAGIAVNGIFNK